MANEKNQNPEGEKDKNACGHGGRCCHCWQIFGAFLLLLIGGIVGYLIGSHCGRRGKEMCGPHGMMGMSAMGDCPMMATPSEAPKEAPAKK